MAQYGEVRVDYITYTTGVAPAEANVTIDVSGLVNNPTFSGNLNVEGNGTVEGNLAVSGNTNLNGANVTISGALGVSGDATLSSLTVTGNTVLEGDITASGITVSGFTGVFVSGTKSNPSITFKDDPDTGIFSVESNQVSVTTAGQNRVNFSSDVPILIGTSTGVEYETNYENGIQIQSVSKSRGGILIQNNGSGSSSNAFVFVKTKGNNPNSTTLVADNDQLGIIKFQGADGNDIKSVGASIEARVDGTPGVNTMPAELLFKTASTSSGATASTRMRIEPEGKVIVQNGLIASGNVQITDPSFLLVSGYRQDKILIPGVYQDPSIHNASIGYIQASTFGALNGEAMVFKMGDTDSNGYLWRQSDQTDDQGQMSLNNDGDLNVRRRLQVGYGQDRTSVSNYVLSVQNSEVQTGGNNNVNVAHIDANYIGTTAFTANRSAVALRVDVDASITGHTTTNNQRLTNYSAYFTNNSTAGAYATYGVRSLVNTTAQPPGTTTTFSYGFYGQSQNYITSSGATANQKSNVIGGVFLGQQGGINTSGEVIGAWCKGQVTTNGSTKTQTLIAGVLGEVEGDHGTLASAFSFYGKVNRDAGTISNGILYGGTNGTEFTNCTKNSWEGTIGTKWGVYITGQDRNRLNGRTTLEQTDTAGTESALDVVTTSGAFGSNNLMQRWIGDSDSLVIRNIAGGDYRIANTQQENYIDLFDGTGGVVIGYADSALLSVISGKVSVTGNLDVTGTVKPSTGIQLDDNKILNFGNAQDAKFYHNGSNLYIDMNLDDDIIIRDVNSSNLVAFRFDTSARRFYAQDNIYAGYNLSSTEGYNNSTNNIIQTFCADVTNQSNPNTWSSTTAIAADYRGKLNEATNEATYHFIANIKDRAGNQATMSKIDVNGNVWGLSSLYAGRTQNSTTSTATNYYGRTGNGYGLKAYNGAPFVTDRLYANTYRAYIHCVSVFDDADDRKAIYGVKSDTDGQADYDQDQYVAISAMGRSDFKGQIRSGRVESDEASPNSIYAAVGWGGGSGVFSYVVNGNSYAAIIGRNTSNSDAVFRSRVNQSSDKVRIQANGQAYTDGAWNNSPADYAEYFEWQDGNPTGEDRRGLPVVLIDGDKIRVATSEDDKENIIGVISAHPAFVGDAAELSWHGMLEKDEFGKPVTEDELWLIWKKEYKDGLPINQPRSNDPDSWDACEGFPLSQLETIEKAISEGTETGVPRWAIDQRCIVNKPKQIISALYDPSQTYIPRSERKEWDTVGLIGKLPVIKGSPIGSRWIKMGEINENLDRYFVR